MADDFADGEPDDEAEEKEAEEGDEAGAVFDEEDVEHRMWRCVGVVEHGDVLADAHSLEELRESAVTFGEGAFAALEFEGHMEDCGFGAAGDAGDASWDRCGASQKAVLHPVEAAACEEGDEEQEDDEALADPDEVDGAWGIRI